MNYLKVAGVVCAAILGAFLVAAISAHAATILFPGGGGTGWGNPGGLQSGNILIGNGLNPIATSSNLTWDNTNNRLSFTFASSTAISASAQVAVPGNGTVTVPSVSVGTGHEGIYQSGTATLGMSNGASTISWNGTTFFPSTSNARNLGDTTHIWLGLLVQNATTTNATTTSQYILGIENPAGSFLATDPNGQVIATTAPSGGSGITALGPTGQTLSGPTITISTTTTAFNGLTSNVTVTGATNNLQFAPTLSGTLGVGGGGTATATMVTNGVLYDNGSNVEADNLLSFDGTQFKVKNSATAATGGDIELRSQNASTFPALFITGINSNSIAQIGWGSGQTRTLQIGNNSGAGKVQLVLGAIPMGGTGNELVGVNATSTPGALLAVAGSAGDTTPLLLISTSTSGFATTTVAEIDQNGTATFGYNGALFGVGTTTPGTLLSIGGNGTGINFVDSATSTFSKAIRASCFSVDGNTCLTSSSGGSGTVNSGTIGQVPYYAANGTAVTATSTLFIDTTSNVGIGTTTPWADFSVNSPPGGTRPLISFATSTAAFATSTAFMLDVNGNVGIGTTSPTYPLNVQGTIYATRWDFFGVFSTAVTGTGNIVLSASPTLSGSVTAPIARGGTAVGSTLILRGTTSATPTQGTAGILLEGGVSGTTEFGRLDGLSGLLGLGTTSPAWQFQLASSSASKNIGGGFAQLALTDTNAGTNLKHWLVSSMGGNLYISTSTDVYATSTNAVLTVDQNGNVIANCFKVPGGSCLSGGGISGSGSSGQVTFWNGASSVTADSNFVWDSTNHRLGVGTTSPFANVSIALSAGQQAAFSVGSSTAQASSTVFEIDGLGHLHFTQQSTPTLTSCGTAGVVTGSDTAGQILIGRGAGQACEMHPAGSFVSVEKCIASLDPNNGGATSTVLSVDSLGDPPNIIFRSSANNFGGGKINYFCFDN